MKGFLWFLPILAISLFSKSGFACDSPESCRDSFRPSMIPMTSSFRLENADILLPPTPSLSAIADFTVEFWIKYDQNQTRWSALWDGGDFGLLARGPDTGMAWKATCSKCGDVIAGDKPANTGQWQHVAYVRRDDKVMLFVDGLMQAQGRASRETIHFTGQDRGGPIRGYSTVIGRGGPPYYPFSDNFISANFNGFAISNVARYGSNFIPPPYLINDGNTLLYLVMRSTGEETLIDTGSLSIPIATHNVRRVADAPFPNLPPAPPSCGGPKDIFCKLVNGNIYIPARISDGANLDERGRSDISDCETQVRGSSPQLYCARVGDSNTFAPRRIRDLGWLDSTPTDLTTCIRQIGR